jgi:hypothetical protein
VLLDQKASEAFGERLGSWVDAAAGPPAMPALAARLRGALTMAAPLLESSLSAVLDRRIPSSWR